MNTIDQAMARRRSSRLLANDFRSNSSTERCQNAFILLISAGVIGAIPSSKRCVGVQLCEHGWMPIRQRMRVWAPRDCRQRVASYRKHGRSTHDSIACTIPPVHLRPRCRKSCTCASCLPRLLDDLPIPQPLEVSPALGGPFGDSVLSARRLAPRLKALAAPRDTVTRLPAYRAYLRAARGHGRASITRVGRSAHARRRSRSAK